MLPYRLYVDSSPERAQPEQPPLAWSELSFLGGGTSQLARFSAVASRWIARGRAAAPPSQGESP